MICMWPSSQQSCLYIVDTIRGWRHGWPSMWWSNGTWQSLLALHTSKYIVYIYGRTRTLVVCGVNNCVHSLLVRRRFGTKHLAIDNRHFRAYVLVLAHVERATPKTYMKCRGPCRKSGDIEQMSLVPFDCCILFRVIALSLSKQNRFH